MNWVFGGVRRCTRTAREPLRADIGDALLAFPTVPHLAPQLSEVTASPEAFAAANLATLRNTMLGSYLRMPGIALPLERGAGALPASLLLSGAEGRDGELLAAAAEVARALAAAAPRGAGPEAPVRACAGPPDRMPTGPEIGWRILQCKMNVLFIVQRNITFADDKSSPTPS